MDREKTKKRNFGFMFTIANYPALKRRVLIALGTIKIKVVLASYIHSTHQK